MCLPNAGNTIHASLQALPRRRGRRADPRSDAAPPLPTGEGSYPQYGYLLPARGLSAAG